MRCPALPRGHQFNLSHDGSGQTLLPIRAPRASTREAADPVAQNDPRVCPEETVKALLA